MQSYSEPAAMYKRFVSSVQFSRCLDSLLLYPVQPRALVVQKAINDVSILTSSEACVTHFVKLFRLATSHAVEDLFPLRQ